MARSSEQNIRRKYWKNESAETLQRKLKANTTSLSTIYNYNLKADAIFNELLLNDKRELEKQEFYFQTVEIVKEFVDTYTEVHEYIKNTNYKLQSIGRKETDILQERYDSIKKDLLKEIVFETKEIEFEITLNKIEALLAQMLGFSLTQRNVVFKLFEREVYEELSQATTLKDNLRNTCSDKINLVNIAMLLVVKLDKELPFSIFSTENEQIVYRNIKSEQTNTEKMCIIHTNLKENFGNEIPFSDEVIYFTVFYTNITEKYRDLVRILKWCEDVIGKLKKSLQMRGDRKYINDTILDETILNDNLEKITYQEFLNHVVVPFIEKKDLPGKEVNTDYICKKLNERQKKIRNLHRTLEKYKEESLCHYLKILPQIMCNKKISEDLEEEQLEIRKLIEDTGEVYYLLQEGKNDIDKFTTFLMNMKGVNDFDKIFELIITLENMQETGINDCFIDIFISKTEYSMKDAEIKENVTFDELLEVINTTTLSLYQVNCLTEIAFTEWNEKKWKFLYFLPIIEKTNHEWFLKFIEMVKLYTE